ncbi:Uncharacterised protein [Rikenella microfusus]|uniref:Uncharacterized protein n=1 Tax=Rikenella microfusus TaxID=28139 RepID=A0A379MT32_9BACT|nr:Uncharacterised protein [Rikenella microfusus]
MVLISVFKYTAFSRFYGCVVAAPCTNYFCRNISDNCNFMLPPVPFCAALRNREAARAQNITITISRVVGRPSPVVAPGWLCGRLTGRLFPRVSAAGGCGPRDREVAKVFPCLFLVRSCQGGTVVSPSALRHKPCDSAISALSGKDRCRSPHRRRSAARRPPRAASRRLWRTRP